MIAYSFGSLVALDNLFPAGWQPVNRIEAVDTLVTIGCPYDIVRMLWPNYFTNRQRMPGRPRVWINIYSPADILASNFRDDNLDAEADKTLALAPPPTPGCDPLFPLNVNYNLGVNPNDLNLFDWLSLVGLRAHNGYWGGSDETELGCFHEIATRLYGEDPIAAGLPEQACAPAGTPSASPELSPASSVLPQTERLPDSDPGTDGDGDGESNAVVDRETDLEPELNAVLRE